MATPDIMKSVDLFEEIARLQPDGQSGRRAEILVKTPTLRVVLTTMKAGIESDEHVVDGPITLQALQGRFSVITGDTATELNQGEFAPLAGGVRHSVRALEDGAFLLTISWLGEEA